MTGSEHVERAPGNDLLLPEGSLLLHVGPSKTGSTAIQVAFDQARDQLGRYGVAYATRYRRVLRPGWAVIGWAPPGHEVPDIGHWERFCARVARLDASRICASTEDFGQVLDSARARTIVDGLGGRRVHVLSVARPYHRLLPSYWQEMVRTNFDTRTYEQWLHDVLDGAPADGHGWAFTGSHNVTRSVPAWLGAVDPDHYTLVVLDEGDRRLLPRVFEQMLGLPDGLLRADGGTNVSLSLNAIEGLRRLNEIRRERDWPLESYVKFVRRGYIEGALAGTASSVDRGLPELPEWAVEPLTRLSAARAEEVRALGVRVVGDVDNLLAPPVHSATPEEFATEAISLDVAVSGVAEVIDLAIRREAAVHEPAAETSGSPAPVDLGQYSGRVLARELGRRVARRLRLRRT